MRTKTKNGGFIQTFHAIVRIDRLTGTETQLTRWDMRKDKVISNFRRSSHHGHGGKLVLRTKGFLTPPREVAA
jgi:hypothetical protein